jgi:hypothetical protein
VGLREADELEAVSSPAWPEIAELAAVGKAHVLSVDPARGRQVLYRLQVSAGSYLGALALRCGGILAAAGPFLGRDLRGYAWGRVGRCRMPGPTTPIPAV